MSLADFQYWLIPESAMGSAVGGTEKIKWEKPENEDEEEDENQEEEPTNRS